MDKELTQESIKKLLDEQTQVILSAVGEKLSIDKIDILSGVNEKLARSETRINDKIEKLTTTLDRFLKRLTDTEDEFTVMKMDINRLKSVVKEKLGVDLS